MAALTSTSIPLELLGQIGGRVGPARLRLPAAVLDRDRLGAAEVEVEERASLSTSSDSARSRTIAGAIVPPGAEDARPSRDQLLGPQRQPELDPVVRAAQVAPGELLDPPDPVAQGVAVAVESPAARSHCPLRSMNASSERSSSPP